MKYPLPPLQDQKSTAPGLQIHCVEFVSSALQAQDPTAPGLQIHCVKSLSLHTKDPTAPGLQSVVSDANANGFGVWSARVFVGATFGVRSIGVLDEDGDDLCELFE